MPYKNLELTPSRYNQTHTSAKSQFYKGFSTLNPNNYGFKLYDFELIKQDIFNHFNTRKGSRVMNPGFGTIVWDLLMEPLTDRIRELLTEDIETICNFDPRVYPLQININEYEKGFLVEITLQMKNTNEQANMKLVFDQTIGLSVL